MNDDLISRSALLGRLEKVVVTDDTFGMGIAFGVDHARGVITEAPAVDAEKVFEQMGLVKEAFDMAKSNLAPVIRCKDCYYWMKAKVNKKGFLICPASGMEITANDYCSYAEKRKCHYDR